jgi:hypothetical protein
MALVGHKFMNNWCVMKLVWNASTATCYPM